MMDTPTLRLEMAAIKLRTYKVLGWSLVVHLIILMFLTIYRSVSPAAQGITEITWLEPAPRPAAPERLPRAPSRIVNPEPRKHEYQEFFRRESPAAEVSPRPQSREADLDKINERLTSLQRETARTRTAVTSLAAPGSVHRPALAGIPEGTAEDREKVELTRRRGGGTTPIELERSAVSASVPAMAVPRTPETVVRPAAAEEAESTTRRSLAGADLVGPVADRPLSAYTTPAYPEWAKREGMEASVTLYFLVLPNGRVKENILIQKTSGYEDFDRNAVTALRTWRFEPVGGGSAGEQWGIITFHYLLKDSG